MSLVEAPRDSEQLRQHRAHQARERRIAARAYIPPKPVTVKRPVPEFVPPPLPKFSGYILDDEYHRAWSIAVLNYDPNGLRHCPRVEDIQRMACAHFGINLNDMLSARRTKELVLPRQVAVYLCRRLTPRSLPDIARRFGGRDHTTAIFAVRKVERLIEDDEHVAASVEMMVQKLGGDVV
jgi:hypothetical protein